MGQFATTYRTHTCGELRAADAAKPVTLAGHVDRRIDERSIEVRDHYGRTRVSLPKNVSPELDEVWKRLGPESVVQVVGTCISRPKEQREPASLAVDPKVAATVRSLGYDPTTLSSGTTGEIEVVAKTLKLLSYAEPLPPEFDTPEVPLEDRLRNRQLDLRRPVMQERLAFRSRFMLEVRNLLASEGFVEVETPSLAKWTKEATQSFIVPINAGRAFALAGTPQQYKQILMAGGVDRYFQIARCFRNEPRLTPERQPEFTTLDLEMAYADEDDIFAIVDKLMSHLFKKVLGVTLKTPIPRITYEEAMLRYGTDRPDLRFGLEIEDLTLFASQVTSKALAGMGGMSALRIAGSAEKLGDGELDAIVKKAAEKGLATVAWAKVLPEKKLRGPAAKLFEAKDVAGLFKALPAAEAGDVLVLSTAKVREAIAEAAGAARTLIGRTLGPASDVKYALALVTRFPFFKYVPEDEAWAPCRHPFTQPLPEDVPLIETDKHRVRGKAYDVVLNGIELGAGSIRNHDLALQRQLFDMFEYKPEEVDSRFGLVLDAFRFGVPPHGGFAIGLDRFIALLHGFEAIDEVIAFPKSRSGEDLLFGAPGEVDPDLVRSLLGG